MIVFKSTKCFEQNSLFPSENYTEYDDELLYVVDETTEKGKELARKIIENAPYFDFVLDNEGNLIDITPTERPEPEITDEEIDEEKIAMAEAIIDLNMRIEELENSLNGGA